MHNSDYLTAALSETLLCLEANRDDELIIPAMTQAYIALAKATNQTPELICQKRGTVMPSIAQLGGETIHSEWDWATTIGKTLKLAEIQQVTLSVFDLCKIDLDKLEDEVIEDGYIIEIESSLEQPTHRYIITEVFENTANRIAQVIKHCLTYYGIEVLDKVQDS
ncbi:hypothetical protein ACQ4M3_08095 [Leptolyngbya sp. AN03gr2]|uniref:hypothetical protein n=1 Tax=unclassified Leptolyngbya TaxID=2650499 RepID=UPI003D31C5E7